MTRKKMTILALQDKKARGEPISMITAYDYPGALAADRAGLDSILVGDSLGMVVLGYDSTVPVTMDEMIHHCKAVRRGAQFAYLIGDLPFMSYQADRAEAVRNAGRFLKEAGMDAVKLEGGRAMAGTVRAITDAGMAVVGHIGLTPQSAAQLGGYRVQGKTAADAQRLLDDALALEAAGAVMIVLEMVPDRVAERSRGGCASRRSASARAWGATARCWCCTTCWGSSTASRRSSSRSTPSFSRRWRPRWLPTATT